MRFGSNGDTSHRYLDPPRARRGYAQIHPSANRLASNPDLRYCMTKDRTAAVETTGIVWVFVILELVLTMLTSYALWAKAGALDPFPASAAAVVSTLLGK